MSFNISISAASVLASASSVRIQDSEEAAGSATQPASYDDGDWCGTKVPGRPRVPVLHVEEIVIAPILVAPIRGF